MTSNEFDQLAGIAAQHDVDALLSKLVDELRNKKQYHQLFEALKMQARRRLGLPILFSDDSNLSDDVRTQLEDALIEACRETGLGLMHDGKAREGWMYMRAVGDRKAAAAAMENIPGNDENLDELVDVLLHEGVDSLRGFSLVLEHYGTCNAITTFETAMPQQSRQDQQAAAALLVKHLHQELTASVKADIARQEGGEPPEDTLAALVADRPWLFQDGAYHIDTTHLASTVRFSRLLDDSVLLGFAIDLTEYGRRLSEQFQYQESEPFADLYPSHALYFKAVAGNEEAEALAYFENKAKTLPVAEHGAAPIETYVELLARLGRNEQAIDALISLSPEDTPLTGLAPSLLELSKNAGSYEKFIDYCRQRNDLLGFATGLAHQCDGSSSGAEVVAEAK